MSRLIAFFLTVGMSATCVADMAEETYREIVDQQGEIVLPTDFRLQWVHLGSWVVADEAAPGHGFHDVYAQPDAVQGYLATGEFPDGSVLVKEIRSIGTGSLTTGDGRWALDKVMWFVMVKDNQRRFDSANWAQGWGWALFMADEPGTNVSSGFTESCRNCHLPARDSDWVFIDGYPTLISLD